MFLFFVIFHKKQKRIFGLYPSMLREFTISLSAFSCHNSVFKYYDEYKS